MTEETERIYVIPLKKNFFPSSKAAPTAIKRVKKYIQRHMKVDTKDIWIDESLNNAVWGKGKYKMPGKIRVKAVRFEDGVVEVYLPELEFEKSRREILQEERAKKQPILRKEEEATEEVDESGTDDYEVVPTADGDVKLKKKKHKELEDESEEDSVESDNKEEISEEDKKAEEAKPSKNKEVKKEKAEKASDESKKDTSEKTKDKTEESTDDKPKKKTNPK
jgi:large subunit ribosomal protein L31e